jgi:hypothetical protein
MHLFLTSSASDNASAEQPANLARAEQSDIASSSAGRVEESSISRCSAEQPAISRLLKMSSIRDVQAWLNGEHVTSCSSAEAQQIREAVAVLSQPKPRQEDVEPLHSKWQVPHWKNYKKTRLQDVIKILEIKVIEAAQTLQQQLASSAEQPAIAAQELNEQTQNRLLNTIDGSSCRHLPQLPGFKPCPPARHYSRHLRQPPVFEHCLLSPKRICRHWGQVLAGIGNSYPRDGKDEAGVGHIYPREETGEGKGEAEEKSNGVGHTYPREGRGEAKETGEGKVEAEDKSTGVEQINSRHGDDGEDRATESSTHRWFREFVPWSEEERSLSLTPPPRRRRRSPREIPLRFTWRRRHHRIRRR